MEYPYRGVFAKKGSGTLSACTHESSERVVEQSEGAKRLRSIHGKGGSGPDSHYSLRAFHGLGIASGETSGDRYGEEKSSRKEAAQQLKLATARPIDGRRAETGGNVWILRIRSIITTINVSQRDSFSTPKVCTCVFLFLHVFIACTYS